jgi:polyisoprenoid-binding protein YceI
MRTNVGKARLASILVITALAAVISGSFSVLAGKSSDGSSPHLEYSQASLSGNYARVGTYEGNIAANWGVVVFDGQGAAKGSATVNQPGPGGSRTIVKVVLDGTYSVNSDGTGTIQYMLTLPGGTTSAITEDFVITKSEKRNGTLIATSIFEAQEQPSVVFSGNVFVSHVDTRRSD